MRKQTPHMKPSIHKIIKVLTALVGRVSLVVGWKNDPEQ